MQIIGALSRDLKRISNERRLDNVDEEAQVCVMSLIVNNYHISMITIAKSCETA